METIWKLFSDGAYKVNETVLGRMNNKKYSSYSDEAKKKALQFYELDSAGNPVKENWKEKIKANSSFYTPDQMEERYNAAKARLESMFANALESWDDSRADYKEFNRRLDEAKVLKSGYYDMITRGEPHISFEKWSVDARFSTLILWDFGVPKITVTGADLTKKGTPKIDWTWNGQGATSGSGEGRTAAEIQGEWRFKKAMKWLGGNLKGIPRRDVLRKGNLETNATNWVITEVHDRTFPERIVRAPITSGLRTFKRITGIGKVGVSPHLWSEIMSEIAQWVNNEPAKIKWVLYTFENHKEVKAEMTALETKIRTYNTEIEHFNKVSAYIEASDALERFRWFNAATRDTVEARFIWEHGKDISIPTPSNAKTIAVTSERDWLAALSKAINELPNEYKVFLKSEISAAGSKPARWVTPADVYLKALNSYDTAFGSIESQWNEVLDKAKKNTDSKLKLGELASDIVKKWEMVNVEGALERIAGRIKQR